MVMLNMLKNLQLLYYCEKKKNKDIQMEAAGISYTTFIIGITKVNF